MVNRRSYKIDLLRGLATIFIIVIHVLQYNLVDPISRFFWNYSHFVVVAFVFCSGYVLEKKYSDRLREIKEILSWWWKRLVRLLLPFYLYLFFHYLLWVLFPYFFSGGGLVKSLTFIRDSLLLIGGIDANWLPLLFIELAFIFPLLKIISKKRKPLIIYSFLALLTTGFYTYNTIIHHSLYHYYRLLMIAPYSLIILLAIKFSNKDKNKYYLITICLGIIIFLILSLSQPLLFHTNLINQKYPPNFYYLSYGLTISFLIIIASRIKILHERKIKNFFTFTSQEAYILYFVSYVVIDFVEKQRKSLWLFNRVINQLFLAIFLTYSVTYGLQLLKKKLVLKQLQD